MLSSGASVVAQGAQPLADTAAANAAADAALLDGTLTSINLGNAGVGTFQTANVDALLGPRTSFFFAFSGTLWRR